MKYKIFTSTNIEMLENEVCIGEANTYQGACKAITQYLTDNNQHQEPYWRFLMNETATFIDYGSWSKFIAIVPPVSMKVMTGEVEEEEE